MKRTLSAFFLLFLLCVCATAGAQQVTANSISSGKYKDGNFERSQDGFKCQYIIDEAKGTVKLSKIISNNREGKIEEGAVYDITNIVVSEGISSLLVSRDKKGQKIITAVRESDLGAFDTLIIGIDFYEFCRAANGRFYLEYGEVTGSER
jgi:hypothetical protein